MAFSKRRSVTKHHGINRAFQVIAPVLEIRRVSRPPPTFFVAAATVKCLSIC
jgi:hypothetical protein